MLFELVFTSYLNAQEIKGYVLKGNLKGLNDGTRLYLVHNKVTGGSDTIASTIAKNQEFLFRGELKEEGEAFFIKFNIDGVIPVDTLNLAEPPKRYITLILENRVIYLSGSINNLSVYAINVIGSQSHLDFVDFKSMEIKILDSINYFLINRGKLLNDSFTAKSLVEEVSRRQGILYDAKVEWISSHLNSFIVPWMVLKTVTSLEMRTMLYSKFDDQVKRSKYGIELKKAIDIEKKMSIGQKFPSFELKTVTGSTLSLKEVVSKGNITIVDFWASWCKPCRSEFPAIRRIYEKYHEKGLNILGYSIDNEYNNWKSAVASEKLPWYNVRGGSRIAEDLYGVNFIPMTFVLNNEGRILGFDLSGTELEDFIRSLIGE